MGLFKILNLHSDINVVEHEAAGRFIPLTQIKTSSELTKLGYNSAIYYPFEIIPGAKDHYLERRLMANPDIIGYGLKNLIQSYFSQSR